VWRTWRAAKAERADIYNARDMYPMFVCRMAARANHAAFVYDSDELNLYRNWPWAKKRWWKTLARAYEGHFIRLADAVITSDHGRADVLVAEYGIARPVIVLNAPPRIEHVDRSEEFRATALGDGTSGARYLLIYQGILVPNRGLPQLVAAMRDLPDCALAFVGYGHLKSELEQLVVTMNLGDRVRFFDPVPYDVMLRYTAAADVGVIPIVGSCLSYTYAAPNKLFEDMMVGVPVVASDLPDMARVVREERVGTLIGDPTDSASIVSAVRELLDAEEPLAQVGARAREAALARYNWDVERPKLVAVFAPLVGRRRA